MQEQTKRNSLSLRRIFGLSSVYGITPIIDRALSLALLPVFTRYLSVDAYGSMVLLYTFGAILQIVACLGFPDTLQKVYWDFDEEERKVCLGTAWVTGIVFNAVLAMPLIIFSQQITTSLMDNDKLGFIFILSITNIGLSTQLIVPYVILRAQERKKEILKVNFISIGSRVGLSLLLVVYFKLNLIGVFLADIGTSFAVQTVYLPVLVREVRIKFEPKYLRWILFISPYQMIVGVMAWIINLSDRMIIQHILSNSAEVAIYSVGYTFGSGINYIINPFLAAWRPYVYSVDINGRKDYQLQMAEFFGFFIMICCVAVMVVLSISGDAIRILTPSAYHNATNIVAVVALAQVMAAIANYFLPTFFIARKVQSVAVVYACSAFVNVVLNFFLISTIGIIGAAFATLLSYIIMAIGLYILSQRKIHLKLPVKTICISIAYTCLFLIAIGELNLHNPYVSFCVRGFILAICVGIPATMIYRLRSRQEFRLT